MHDFFCPVQQYLNFKDLKKEIMKFIPEICFLFSGYLLTINKLLSVAELTEMLSLLKINRIKIVTSDPWLNIWSNLNTFEYKSLNFNDPMQENMIKTFTPLTKLYKDVQHFYLFLPDNHPIYSLKANCRLLCDDFEQGDFKKKDLQKKYSIYTACFKVTV